MSRIFADFPPLLVVTASDSHLSVAGHCFTDARRSPPTYLLGNCSGRPGIKPNLSLCFFNGMPTARYASVSLAPGQMRQVSSFSSVVFAAFEMKLRNGFQLHRRLVDGSTAVRSPPRLACRQLRNTTGSVFFFSRYFRHRRQEPMLRPRSRMVAGNCVGAPSQKVVPIKMI